MSRGKLFIHIGTQKTGTSTIQSILSKNNKKLLEEGICYLGRFTKLARKIRVITDPDDDLSEKLYREIKSEISGFQSNKPHTYILSNEKFSGDKLISYRNAGRIAQLLKKAVEPLNFDVKIILFLRRQDSYIESTYAQRVYSGSSSSFDQFMSQFDENDFHWDQFINQYSEVFGEDNIIVHPFDKKYLPKKESLIQVLGEDISSQFLQNYSKKMVKNKGFTRNALEISRITNQYLDKKEMRQFRDLLKQSDIGGGKCIFFTPEERLRFLENYDESNKKVAQKYVADSNNELFSSPRLDEIKSNDKYQELTTESTAVLLSKVILDLNQEIKEKIEEKNRKGPLERKVYSLYKKFRKTLQKLQ